MTGIRRIIGAGTALGVAAAVAACGNAGTVRAGGAAPSAAGGVATTAPATTAPSTVAPTPAQLRSSVLRAALLPKDALGPDLTYASDTPLNRDYFPELPVWPRQENTDCDAVVDGGANTDARAFAEAVLVGPDGNSLSFVEAARQYDAQDGAMLFDVLALQIQGKCAKHTTKTDDGKTIDHAVTITAKSGLGDGASLIEDFTTVAGGGYLPMVFDTLVVRYGDVVISVGCSGPEKSVHGYDLAAKVQAFADRLNLRH